MWIDPGNIEIAHMLMNVEIEAVQFLFLGIHKWDFLCSVITFVGCSSKRLWYSPPRVIGTKACDVCFTFYLDKDDG